MYTKFWSEAPQDRLCIAWGMLLACSPYTGLDRPLGWGFWVSRQSAHEGGKVISPSHRPPLPPSPGRYPWYFYLLEFESTPDTRDLPACSAVPQPAAPPRALVLVWILNEREIRVWARFVWLRLGTSRGHLCIRYWTFGFSSGVNIRLPVDLVWLEKTFFGRNSCSYDLHRPICIHLCIKVFFNLL